ncbi:Putative membrane bound ClpP class protease [Myxococcus hansupus]|uniref:Putative membrane bound ClpP class protease n=1 Tax=Pseudomyxococcus hansupus TaxID=1297742 RepID=A0A0H4X6T7_9BACT|nr:nodulation protein NfeD [Myxococcus hansupus]AKQ69310.1 Putative membrane bound ClpP class protease [Myxococcus hansupus]
MPRQSPWRRTAPALLCVLLAGLLASASEAPSAGTQPVVARCELDGVVDLGASSYLADCVARAEAGGHGALLVRLDTPGGSLEATRAIVRTFLASPLPVLVWVGPSGAHAGSAGVFITLASNVAAMAPGTNIGAAHPVAGISGQDPEAAGGTHLARKVENDAVAFAESIAQQRGRNVEWAASAVRDSVSVSAAQARALRVVEYEAATEADFLAQADGRQVTVAGGESVRLSTRDARIVELEPSLSQRAIHALANPGIVYLLFLVAALGLVVEVSHPGGIVPGLIGGVALVLALVASSALPVRAGAVVLMMLGAALIVAELFVTSGLLGAAGVVLLGLGGLFLVDRFDPAWFVDRSFHVSWTWLVPTTVVLAGAAAYVAYRSAQTRRLPQRVGDLGLVGEHGTALAQVTPQNGEVFVHGERWRATSTTPIRSGAHVVVRGMEGLTLFVDEVPT